MSQSRYLKIAGFPLGFIAATYVLLIVWRSYAAGFLYERAQPTNLAEPAEARISRYKKVLRQLDTAVKLNPLDAGYRFAFAQSLLEIIEDKELAEFSELIYPSKDILSAARDNYVASLKLELFNHWPHLGLGRVYIHLQDWSKAQEEFRRAAELGFTDAQLHYKLAGYYLALFPEGRLNDAYEEYKKALLYAEPEFQLKIMEEIYQSHAQDYNWLTAIIPDTAQARHAFAGFLREKKIYNESIAEFKKAAELVREKRENDILADSYNWIGIIYMWQANYGQAVEYFNKSLIFARDRLYKSWVFRNLGNKIGRASCRERV